jgi:hypothetical protein
MQSRRINTIKIRARTQLATYVQRRYGRMTASLASNTVPALKGVQ